ncbi:MAG: cartilage oligomeric matrix protein [Parcubacteria group bacterium Gr01-1014_3]|nr:MAG: cartilage oligomeric matrix protein [Parcubacteria group bacterium Gr01-1014_3]
MKKHIILTAQGLALVAITFLAGMASAQQQQDVLFEQLISTRTYSIYPNHPAPRSNDAFAQNFILAVAGSLTEVQMPARINGGPARIDFYELPSMSAFPDDPAAVLIGSYPTTEPGDLDNFPTVVETSASPLQLRANQPYALVIEVPNVQGGVFDIRASDSIDAYPAGRLMLRRSYGWDYFPGNDLTFRLLGSTVLNVAIDIKPGSYPNSVNTGSNGNIPVAILSSQDFDAPGSVDISSLTFGKIGNELSLKKCSGSEDVNMDNRLDLICHFYTARAGFQVGDTVGVLKGKTNSNNAIRGEDLVRIVK